MVAARQNSTEMMGIFLAIGKGLVIHAGGFLETFGADDVLIALIVCVYQGFLFIQIAAAVFTFKHGCIPPGLMLIIAIYKKTNTIVPQNRCADYCCQRFLSFHLSMNTNSAKMRLRKK